MKSEVHNLKDITDSKEVLEAKPHPFTSMLIYILITLLVTAIVWSYFGEVDIVIKSNGVVRPNENVSKIINKIYGKVESINMHEGQNVKKGDILYTIEYTNLTLEEKTFFDEFKKVTKENSNLSKLKESIGNNKNYFDNNNEDEKDYYNKYLKYYLDNEKLKLENKQSQIRLEQTKNEKSIIQKKLDIQVNNTEQEIFKIQMSKYKIDTLVDIDENIKINKTKIQELEKNIKAININIDDCIVKSPMDGVVSIIKDVTVQELLQSGIEIATINPNNTNNYKIQLYLANKDIADIKVGDKLKYHFQALPYEEYGELTGTLTKISVDAKVDEQSGNSYYVAESYVENKTLYSYKGKKSKLKLGMSCEAQIITKRKKILYYLLEKINLKD
ncbi:HlyD family efflux transporter periplasmic adaptor subunit [Clostridium sp. FP2]|uniref:HlyD family efflux transporter periplasmic adaptor subunit n=1 Tax=Clostridium sp. FP2 TaxID=2724481 RepID=UPI0013E911F9|nr:HlyD family efflux transporter periplasmic adaptor subunit [Clostridium sp. FP2]MBZ9621685.1 HlyD family efflux transporter periplasmic adaptor subunit [Clostridium sp. FP2]